MSEVISRSSKVAQWGNSAAVRLTSAALEQAHLHLDDPVDIISRDGEIVIRRQRPRLTMSDLLAAFDPAKHRHELAFDDGPVGSETR